MAERLPNYIFEKERVERFEKSFEHENDHIHEHRVERTTDENKAIINRLSRAIGHLESIKFMIADGRDCAEILTQLSAVKSAVNNAGIALIQNDINHCVAEAVQTGDYSAVDDLNRALGRYVK